MVWEGDGLAAEISPEDSEELLETIWIMPVLWAPKVIQASPAKKFRLNNCKSQSHTLT